MLRKLSYALCVLSVVLMSGCIEVLWTDTVRLPTITIELPRPAAVIDAMIDEGP